MKGKFVTAVAVSPLGNWFATSGDQGIVDLWDTDTGALRWSSDGHGSRMFSGVPACSW